MAGDFITPNMNNVSNKRGSILLLALTFVLTFALLFSMGNPTSFDILGFEIPTFIAGLAVIGLGFLIAMFGLPPIGMIVGLIGFWHIIHWLLFGLFLNL